MLKLATIAVFTISTAALSWTGYRAAAAKPAETPQAAASDSERDAAYRHRHGMPNHWRSYVLNQRRY